jgi:hypothetical protein
MMWRSQQTQYIIFYNTVVLGRYRRKRASILNELDPQIKLLLEQLKAKAAQSPVSATPLSEQEKILAMRRMMVDFVALGVPSEPVSRVTSFGIPGPAGEIPIRLGRVPTINTKSG